MPQRYTQGGLMEKLADREIEALDLFSRGMQQSRIAFELNCSIQQVKNIMRDTRNKLGANTTAEAVRLYYSKV